MDWPAIASVAREWGLPLAVLLGLGFLMLKKRGKRKRPDGSEVDLAAFLITGYQLDEAHVLIERQEREHGQDIDALQARHDREIAYIEARRSEEREGRVAAERRVSELTERWDRALSSLSSIERELIRASANASRTFDQDHG